MNDISSSLQSKTPQLEIHEWLAIVIIVGFFLMLTCISLIRDESLPETSNGTPHYLKPQWVDVLIQGAVDNPGNYKISTGSSVLQAIAQAQPHKEADLRRFKSSSKVRPGQVINIPTRPQISISIEGAVESPGIIRVPKGSRTKELGQFVKFSSNADPVKIKHSQYLREGDRIIVPNKNGS